MDWGIISRRSIPFSLYNFKMSNHEYFRLWLFEGGVLGVVFVGGGFKSCRGSFSCSRGRLLEDYPDGNPTQKGCKRQVYLVWLSIKYFLCAVLLQIFYVGTPKSSSRKQFERCPSSDVGDNGTFKDKNIHMKTFVRQIINQGSSNQEINNPEFKSKLMHFLCRR